MNHLLGNSNEAEARRDENGDEEQLGHVPRQQPQAQQISAREKFIKSNRFELIKMGVFATLILINLYALPDIKIGC